MTTFCNTKETMQQDQMLLFASFCETYNLAKPAFLGTADGGTEQDLKTSWLQSITPPTKSTFTPGYIATWCGGSAKSGGTLSDPTSGTVEIAYNPSCDDDGAFESWLKHVCNHTFYDVRGCCDEDILRGEFSRINVLPIDGSLNLSSVTADTQAVSKAALIDTYTGTLRDYYTINKYNLDDQSDKFITENVVGVFGSAYYAKSCKVRAGQQCNCGRSSCLIGDEWIATPVIDGTSVHVEYKLGPNYNRYTIGDYDQVGRPSGNIMNVNGKLVIPFNDVDRNGMGYWILETDQDGYIVGHKEVFTDEFGATQSRSKSAVCGNKVKTMSQTGHLIEFDPRRETITLIEDFEEEAIVSDIACCGEKILIAFGSGSSLIRYSANSGGIFFDNSTGLNMPPTGFGATSVAFMPDGGWQIGMNTGELYVTRDQTKSYILQHKFDSAVGSIAWATHEVGYVITHDGTLYDMIEGHIVSQQESWRSRHNQGAALPSGAFGNNQQIVTLQFKDNPDLNVNRLVISGGKQVVTGASPILFRDR